jgi:hypothetical protein
LIHGSKRGERHGEYECSAALRVIHEMLPRFPQ